ncbi:MAG: hypothetical protein ACOH1T_07865 [Microbacteriaceae bacterium]
MGIPLPARLEADPTLHVSVPQPRVAPTGKRIAGHVSSFAEHQLWHDVRVSPPARAWCELGRTLDLASLVAAGDYLIHHALPIASRRELADAVTHWGARAGAARLREALGLLSDRSESPKESVLRVILVTSGLTDLAVNLAIRTSGGFNYRADLAFARQKLVIEYQSRFHDGTKPFANDMTRKSRLEADGWYVFEVNAQDLENSVELIARIRTVLAHRASVSG